MHELACGAANERDSPGAAATPPEAQGGEAAGSSAPRSAHASIYFSLTVVWLAPLRFPLRGDSLWGDLFMGSNVTGLHQLIIALGVRAEQTWTRKPLSPTEWSAFIKWNTHCRMRWFLLDACPVETRRASGSNYEESIWTVEKANFSN